MKTKLSIAILFLAFTNGYSQDSRVDKLAGYNQSVKQEQKGDDFTQNLWYDIHGAYTHSVTKEKLKVTKSLSELNPGYPANWLADFISTEISSTCNGKPMKAVSTSSNLTIEQKNILNTADIGADIILNVKYKSQNSATGKIETRIMNFVVTVIPEVEAEYRGGHLEMKKYLKDNVIDKNYDLVSKESLKGKVRFIIDEEGRIENVKITESTGDAKADKSLLDAIIQMPKWKPAENSKGVKVKQEFEFGVGNSGC